MLSRFRQAKQQEITRLQRTPPPAPFSGPRPDFAAALLGAAEIAVIAEYKRASPSRGVIREDLTVENVAVQYRTGGAAAMSVLTEDQFFQGNLAFLPRAWNSTNGQLPLLRKDFIFDPLQVDATAATPASAMLLIVRMLRDADSLRSLRERAESYGMAAVVEIFDLEDLRIARDAGARIIQVNARDLDTLRVSRSACLELVGKGMPTSSEIWVAASGINAPEHLAEAQDAGFRAALVGTALMRAPEPGAALAWLLGGRACV